MVAFASAVAAVRCAVEHAARDHGAADGARVRIGLAAGEPLPDGDDLYGTPVIVASRLCEAAGAGRDRRLGRRAPDRRPARRASCSIRRGAAAAGHPRAGGGARRCAGARTTTARPRRPRARRPGEITVVIADDQRLLRTGFRVILDGEPDMRVVGEAPDGARRGRRRAAAAPRRGAHGHPHARARRPRGAAERILADPDVATAVVMLTTFDRDEYVYEALRIGASGFLLKDTPADRLLDAIRVAAPATRFLAPSITRRLIERSPSRAPGARRRPPGARPAHGPRARRAAPGRARPLERRDRRRAGARARTPSRRTSPGVLRKLGLRDRVQAVVLAYETGLVAPESRSERSAQLADQVRDRVDDRATGGRGSARPPRRS